MTVNEPLANKFEALALIVWELQAQGLTDEEIAEHPSYQEAWDNVYGTGDDPYDEYCAMAPWE